MQWPLFGFSSCVPFRENTPQGGRCGSEPAGKSTPRAPSPKEAAAVAGKQPKKTSIIREGVGRKTYLSKVAFFAGVSGEQK